MGLVEKLGEWMRQRRERKAAHLRTDNRASPTTSVRWEQGEPPGKRQAGEENQNVGQP